MQFSFEVDPDLDVAIGVEADLKEEVEMEDFEASATGPTGAKPGSEDKVRMLTARYAAGVPLWHNSDCYDHGPANLETDDEEDEFGNFDLDEL